MCDTAMKDMGTTNRSNSSHITFLTKLDKCLMQEDIFVTFLPLVIIVGTFSNGMCIFVFRRRKLRTLSIGFYLYVYAVANLLNLYMSYGMTWLSLVSDVTHFENYTDWGCRIWEFIYRIVAYSGIWILVAALVDRYISLCHPSYAERMCDVFMAKMALVMVFTGLFVISVHAMWSYELRQNMCVPIQEDLHSIIWRWMSASCYVFIPLVTLFLLSLAMYIEMCTRRRPGYLPKQIEAPTNLAYTVLVLSGVYQILALPATIVNIIDNSLPIRHYNDADLMYTLEMIRFISGLLACLNPAILFVICVLFSRMFRDELVKGLKVLCVFRRNNGPITTELMSNGHPCVEMCLEDSSDQTFL